MKQPIRCFEGSQKPGERFWNIRNDASEGKEAEIELYGWISEISWMDDEITPKMFKDDLYLAGKGGPITIRLNSAGGDVIAASMMRSIIMDYPGKVTVRIDGLAASAATVVATAGDRVVMQDSAYFMIHDPLMVFFMAALNIEELKRITDTLKSVKDGIIQAYAAKSGMSREKLSRLMTDETWFDAESAKAAGFVDEIVRPGGKAGAGSKDAMRMAVVNAARLYARMPERLREMADESPLTPLLEDHPAGEKGGEERGGEMEESEGIIPTPTLPLERGGENKTGESGESEPGEKDGAGQEGSTSAGENGLDATARRLRAECSIFKRA